MGSIVPEPYFLKSARLGFRCWTKDDLSLARELWGDIEVTRFFGGPFSSEEIAQRLEREIAQMNAHQFQYWPIHLLSDKSTWAAAVYARTGWRTGYMNWDSICGRNIGVEGWRWRPPPR
jgi:RimJ/RimL family protein N-acetyltransferase